MTTRTIRYIAAFLLLAAGLASAPAASAQCAMCTSAAAAQQAEARKALNLGIGALIMPAFLLIGGFVFLTYKRRNPPDDPSGKLPGFTESAIPRSTVVNLPLDDSSDRPQSSA